LDFGLFRYLKRVIDLDSKVSNGAFQLAMLQAGAEQLADSSFAYSSA
jgi:hypothetical protein